MNVKIKSNFRFSVVSIQYSPCGELCISLACDEISEENQYHYSANLGDGQSEEMPRVSLLQYVMDYASTSNIKPKTRDSYRLMCKHLEAYGNCTIDRVTTGYLQGFITHLQSQGLRTGSVRLYFQKLACVLHEAYRNGLFDRRILERVNRPKRDQEKKCFLTEAELKKLARHTRKDEDSNIHTMFLFSCLTGLRFSDVQGLRWKNVRRNGKHLRLEFHQKKTDTQEVLPLCEEAEALLRRLQRRGNYVFPRETNQKTNTVLKRWCRESGIRKNVSFHCARHTFCVLLLTKEVPIYTVQELMCHADIGTTKVYADLLSKTKSKAIKRLPTIMC